MRGPVLKVRAAPLTEAQVAQARALRAAGRSYQSIAVVLGCKWSQVRLALLREP